MIYMFACTGCDHDTMYSNVFAVNTAAIELWINHNIDDNYRIEIRNKKVINIKIYIESDIRKLKTLKATKAKISESEWKLFSETRNKLQR